MASLESYPTHSWLRVVEFYRRSAAERPGLSAMADLVERIAQSDYASGLHPVTSHYLLRLFASEHFDFWDDQIQISHDGESFEVRYVSSAGRPLSTVPAESRWMKRSPDGFAALMRCLHHVRWFVEERPATSRPAV